MKNWKAKEIEKQPKQVREDIVGLRLKNYQEHTAYKGILYLLSILHFYICHMQTSGSLAF